LSHSDGYETVYSNLLASDFVSVRWYGWARTSYWNCRRKC
jgi:hypothetical protein